MSKELTDTKKTLQRVEAGTSSLEEYRQLSKQRGISLVKLKR